MSNATEARDTYEDEQVRRALVSILRGAGHADQELNGRTTGNMAELVRFLVHDQRQEIFSLKAWKARVQDRFKDLLT